MMILLLTILAVLACPMVLFQAGAASAEVAGAEPAGDYAVLLHGLGRTAISMKGLERHLKRQGYRVVNVAYPSKRFSVEYLSDVCLQGMLEKRISDPAARIHFVTHSLGGIILRRYLSCHHLENLGRVVMLAPPNQGSEIIDRLKTCALIRKVLGPAMLELGTGPDDFPGRLGPVHFECGVIAGDRSLNPFLSRLLPGPNDGKVTVASTWVPGVQDSLVLHSTHTWMMWRERTLRQTALFLRSGHFDQPA